MRFSSALVKHATFRSSPNPGFRSRSLFRVEFRNSFLSKALARTVGERIAYLLG